ncbi:2'-5'-oligoadenylate synthase-like protein 2 [Branchiostoma floridae x Branchiostoma japonicum]
MFISELPPIDSDDYYGQLQRHLEQMERALIRSKNSIAYNFEVVGRTSYAVQLRVKTQKRDHESHDVDLLLATDLLGPVLSSIKKEEVYAMMGRMDARSRENCSAALVELQRDFVKKQPAEVKDLIRLVKMWKSSCVTETSLTSYPLELLCIHTWPSYGTVSAAFQAVLQKLRDYSSICAYWTDNYSFHRVQTMLGKRPLILDPANPYNNVADRCRDWDAVARAAKKTLQKPFFSRY